MAQTDKQITPHYEEDMIEIDLREYIGLLWRRKWIIIGLVIVAVIASYFISQQMTRIYQSSTLVMVKEDSGVQDLFSDQMSLFTGKTNKIATYTQMLKSRLTLQKVIEDLDLRSEETGEYISTGSLSSAISIAAQGDTNLIKITITYPDPVIAKDIANQIVQVFKEENQQFNRADLRSASEFITEQVSQVRQNLSNLEEKLLQYKQEHDIILPDTYGKNLLDELTELQMSKARTELNIEQARLSLKEFKQHLTKEDEEIISTKIISDNPIVAANRKRLVDLEIELAGLLDVYTEKHPKVIEVKKKIAEVKKLLANSVKEIITSRTQTINPLYQSFREKVITFQITMITGQAQLDTYNHQINEIQSELEALPEKELKLARLQREAKVSENIYLMLMNRQEEIQIQEAMQSSDITVVDPAIVQDDPIKPRVKLNVVIAAFLAIFIAVFIIFLLEYLDTTVKEEKDVEGLTGLPVIGVIPLIDQIDHSRGYGRDEQDVE